MYFSIFLNIYSQTRKNYIYKNIIELLEGEFMIKWMKDIRERIAKIPIRFIVIAYIAVIVSFAFIYTTIPSGFYHQTISLEKSYEKEAVNFSNKILKVIKENFKEIYQSEEIEFDDIKIDIRSLEAEKSYVESERVIVPINLKVEVHGGGCSEKNVVYEDFFDISLGTNILKINKNLYVPLVITSNVFVECSDIDVTKINYNQLFKNKGFLSPVIQVDENIEKEIDNFLLASKGYSNEVNSHFFSMLYLSAVTITTIGYGDIVPITFFTRTLITIEALTGMILMGIFLNNITYKK